MRLTWPSPIVIAPRSAVSIMMQEPTCKISRSMDTVSLVAKWKVCARRWRGAHGRRDHGPAVDRGNGFAVAGMNGILPKPG